MGSEEASRPRGVEVALSEDGQAQLGGKSVRVMPLRTGAVLDICGTLRKEGIGLDNVLRKTGRKVPHPMGRTDKEGKVLVVDEWTAGADLWGIPEIILTAMCASTGLTWDHVRDLPPEDAFTITGAVISQTNWDSILTAVKNLLGAARGKWAAMLSSIPTTGPKSS